MSTILEEGSIFRSSNKSISEDKERQEKFAKDHPYDTAEANFPISHSDPFRVNMSPPKYVTNLDVAIEESKAVRATALKNAKTALEEAFEGKYKDMINERVSEEDRKVVLTQSDLQKMIGNKPAIKNIVKESNRSNPNFNPIELSQKSYDDTKKIVDTFREKTAAYPKYISYDGAMVLCVMFAMKSEVRFHITNLPSEDQDIIRGLLPNSVAKHLDYFSVKFDKEKDFILYDFSALYDFSKSNDVVLNLFNAVAHPRSEDLKDVGPGAVSVEDNGDKITVGGIAMNKRTIQKVMGIEPKKEVVASPSSSEEVDNTLRRQPVAGRNAYEIRADVLQMAIDWSGKNTTKIRTDDDDVVALAKKFYTFVENRR